MKLEERDRVLLRSMAVSNTFRVWQPSTVCIGEDLSKAVPRQVEVLKSFTTRNILKATDRTIGGYCSTENWDRQKEKLLAEGLIFSECVNAGWFNDNHMQDHDCIVGIPTDTQLHRMPSGCLRWYAKGFLLEGNGEQRYDKIWEAAKALAKVGRKLGFSVEGEVVDRNGPVVHKAIIRNIAITPNPVNMECTWDILYKAMSGSEDLYKALGVGSSVVPVGGGSVLVTQDLEGSPKHDTYTCEECGEGFSNPSVLDEHMEKSKHSGWKVHKSKKLTFQEATTHLIKSGLTEDVAVSVVRYALKLGNRE